MEVSTCPFRNKEQKETNKGRLRYLFMTGEQYVRKIDELKENPLGLLHYSRLNLEHVPPNLGMQSNSAAIEGWDACGKLAWK